MSVQYTEADYHVGHPVLKRQLARWQVKPYPNDSDPRPLPTHEAMQDHFETPEELVTYIGMILADVPHNDILDDFMRGEARPYYTRGEYIVDAMHLVTLLSAQFEERPVESDEWKTLLASALRAVRRFGPAPSNKQLSQTIKSLRRYPVVDTGALLGRHTHHETGSPTRRESYRAKALIESGYALQTGVAFDYLDRLAGASLPLFGNSLRFVIHAAEWEDAGVDPEYAGSLARPLEVADGLGPLTEGVIVLHQGGVPAEYARTCALHQMSAASIVAAWKNNLAPEYAVSFLS
jgi:hypothetical protein